MEVHTTSDSRFPAGPAMDENDAGRFNMNSGNDASSPTGDSEPISTNSAPGILATPMDGPMDGPMDDSISLTGADISELSPNSMDGSPIASSSGSDGGRPNPSASGDTSSGTRHSSTQHARFSNGHVPEPFDAASLNALNFGFILGAAVALARNNPSRLPNFRTFCQHISLPSVHPLNSNSLALANRPCRLTAHTDARDSFTFNGNKSQKPMVNQGSLQDPAPCDEYLSDDDIPDPFSAFDAARGRPGADSNSHDNSKKPVAAVIIDVIDLTGEDNPCTVTMEKSLPTPLKRKRKQKRSGSRKVQRIK